MADQNNKPLFGSAAAPQSGGFGFGNASTGTPPASGGLFGGAGGSGGSGGGTPLFGAAATQGEDTKKPAAPTSLFGSLSTPNKPATPPVSTPANTQGGPSNTSTTPMVSPPPASGGLFGQSAGGGGANLFANLGSAQNSSTSAAPTSTPFGATSNNTPKSGGSLFGGQASSAGSGLFGGGTASTGGGLFGQKTNQEQASQEQTKSSSGLFGAKPASGTTDSSQKPNLFGGAGTTSAAPTSSSPAPTKPLFGAAPATATSQTSTTGAPTSSGLFGTPSSGQGPSNPFGATPRAEAATSTAQSGNSNTAPATTSAGLFGGQQTSTQGASSSAQPAPSLFGSLNKPNTTTAPASSQPAGGASLFGSATGNTQAATATSTAATTAGNATTSNAPSQPAAAATSNNAQSGGSAAMFATSTAGPTPTPQSRLKNKTMDEIITRWATDLKKYQKEFQTQADKVAQWDRLLVENSNAITKLYSRTFQAERDTAEVQKQLSAVEDNQAELSQWLDRYEQEVEALMAKEGMGQREGLQGPDQERERTYKAAERVQEKLSDMGNELTGLIEEINSVSSSLSNNSKPDDPLSQIVRILNTHLSQLQQIDQDTAALQAKVAAAKAESQRLGYRSSGISSAADDFYRSLRSAR